MLFGDINTTLFVAPPQIGPLILGVGPIIELPTAVNDGVGAGFGKVFHARPATDQRRRAGVFQRRPA